MDSILLNKKRFFAALKEYKKTYGHGVQNYIAISTGKSKGYISRIFQAFRDESKIKELKISFELQIEIAEACNSDYVAFLQRGKEILQEVSLSPQAKDKLVKIESKEDQEHLEVVKQFIERKKAVNFNRFLVNIEKKDPQTYNEMYKEAEMADKMIRRHGIGGAKFIEKENGKASGE